MTSINCGWASHQNKLSFWVFLLIFLTALTSEQAQGQEDTSTVQLIEFSDGLAKRRAWHMFPASDNGKTYRKVMMYHTLKCDPSLINNPTGSGCGEWDAGANFHFYDHSYHDSLRYRTNLSYPETIEITTNPTYTKYQSTQYEIVYDVVGSESSSAVGSGNTAITHTLQSAHHSGRAQYLFTASELQNAGMTAGSIDKLELDISTLGSNLRNLTIKMKHSALAAITTDAYETDNLQTVYELNTNIGAIGTHTFNLTMPFVWDGTSNIVIEWAFTNNQGGTNHAIEGHATGFSSAVYSTGNDQYMEFGQRLHRSNHKHHWPAARQPHYGFFLDLHHRFFAHEWHSGSFWGRGFQQHLETPEPNATRKRPVLLVCREYQRIGQHQLGISVNKSTYLGWNHWTFTKNATTSNMEVYLNGEIFIEGNTGNTRLMDNIAEFRIGNSRAFDQNYFRGGMNEFQIWNTVLDSATINNWMYKDVDATHPNYSNLLAYYKFDGTAQATATDETGNSQGNMLGIPERKFVPGPALSRNLAQANERPNITFVQGSYTHPPEPDCIAGFGGQ